MGMVIKNPVIVSALYDIGRDKWESFNVSYDTYLYWMKNTLSLKSKMVIFTEKKFVPIIKSFRQSIDSELTETLIVEQELCDLEAYQLYYDQLNELMNSDSFKLKISHRVPEMTKPLYNIIMFNKLYFLKSVNDHRFFDNDLLIWADAGGLREQIDNYKHVCWPSLEKINQLDHSKPTFFSHSSNIKITDKEYHALSQIRYIQGTSFFVPSTIIDKLIQEFNITINECVNNKYIGSDEKIFDLTYINNPNSYSLIKCGWREYFNIFSNKH